MGYWCSNRESDLSRYRASDDPGRAAGNRPIHEVLFPNLRDISGEYEGTFKGMTTEPVALKALESARERMIAELKAGLDAAEREFLLSLARNAPNWDLLGIEHLEQLPGIRRKLANLGRLAKANPKKLKEQVHELERQLGKNA